MRISIKEPEIVSPCSAPGVYRLTHCCGFTSYATWRSSFWRGKKSGHCLKCRSIWVNFSMIIHDYISFMSQCEWPSYQFNVSVM